MSGYRARRLRVEALEDRRMLAVFTVSNNNDSGAGSLRDAITQANNAAGVDTIDFDATVFSGGDNSLIRLTTGELEITESLTIDGSSGTGVTITGDANDDDITDANHITNVNDSTAQEDLLDDNSRVLHFSPMSGDLTLTGVAITGGRTAATLGDGGGIRFVSYGRLALNETTVSGNSTVGITSPGGGISASAGLVELAASRVVGNSTTGSRSNGGGIQVRVGSVILIDSEVRNNTTEGGIARGGGIWSESGSVTLIRSTVSGNTTTGGSSDGGGIHTRSGNVNLTDSDVTGNSTAGFVAQGGGIYSDSGLISLNHSTVSGNRTTGFGAEGGGIATFVGSVELTDSVLSGNSTNADGSRGGGIYQVLGSITLAGSVLHTNSTAGRDASGGGIYTGKGSVTLDSSTLSGNFTSGIDSHAGGILTTGGLVSITDSTISDNHTSGDGGGVFFFNSENDPALTIENSILAGNTENGGSPNDLVLGPDSVVTINHSLVGVADNITQTITGNVNNQTGTAEQPLDPLLGPLANNGGPTPTHALLPGSPAIDAGDLSLLPDANEFDQRGAPFVRVAQGLVSGIFFPRIDIGAYEAQGPPLADFDFNLAVNGNDFLIWQRGFGTTGGATANEGDADNDGDIDVSDLAVWEVSYGDAIVVPPLVDELSAVSSQPAAELIDAAMAWELREGSPDDEVEAVDERQTFAGSSFASSPNARGLAPPASRAAYRDSGTDSETGAAREPWLPDELLERVFE